MAGRLCSPCAVGAGGSDATPATAHGGQSSRSDITAAKRRSIPEPVLAVESISCVWKRPSPVLLAYLLYFGSVLQKREFLTPLCHLSQFANVQWIDKSCAYPFDFCIYPYFRSDTRIVHVLNEGNDACAHFSAGRVFPQADFCFRAAENVKIRRIRRFSSPTPACGQALRPLYWRL